MVGPGGCGAGERVAEVLQEGQALGGGTGVDIRDGVGGAGEEVADAQGAADGGREEAEA